MTDSAVQEPVGDARSPAHPLFSYGTLALPSVQVAVFGRPVPSRPDALLGFELNQLTITDPEVLRTSGLAVHPILVPSTDPQAEVAGVVLTLSDPELAAADHYEVDDYARVRARLRSGGWAWAYVAADPRL